MIPEAGEGILLFSQMSADDKTESSNGDEAFVVCCPCSILFPSQLADNGNGKTKFIMPRASLKLSSTHTFCKIQQQNAL